MSSDPSPAPLAADQTSSSVGDLALLSQIVEASSDAIFSEDAAGRITSWNAAAERIYGCAAQVMLGSSVEEHFPAVTAEQLREMRRVAAAGRRVERFDAWHVRPDGRRIAVSLTASPLVDAGGVVVGMATTVQDTTERVELAAELERLRLLNEEQNLVLTRSNRDLEQFAFVASHDLSEPLRAMSGFAQLLEKKYAPVLDERGRGYLDHIVAGATRMRALIEDLLEYSRFVVIDSPASRVDVGAVARDVVGSLGLTGVLQRWRGRRRISHRSPAASSRPSSTVAGRQPWVWHERRWPAPTMHGTSTSASSRPPFVSWVAAGSATR